MHLIIDADPIVYQAGFAAEKCDYHLILETPGGQLIEKLFKPTPNKSAGDAMKAYLKAHEGFEILSKERVVHPDSEADALEKLRTKLLSIEKEIRDRYRGIEFTDITVVLSGPGNYREGLATIFPYKGNRDPSHKPYHYQAIRNCLTKDWGAVVVHGREADDECSILARKCLNANTDFIIATIDKDLDQIPGKHYNYGKNVFHTQSVESSNRFFIQQSISGDPTDGIPGCYKQGEGRASKHADRLSQLDKQSVWSGIVQLYAESQRLHGCPYVGKSAEAVALETARLVYLQQEEGELWIPTGPPHDKLPEYRDE